MKCEYRHNDVIDIVAVQSKSRSSFTSVPVLIHTNSNDCAWTCFLHKRMCIGARGYGYHGHW